ncbi:type II toxin-antitoxin system HicB family antitoxin [Patescibacteria group bacterium]|nr:type II toxin-antitoxin system HicB family antitoxin [Patescibacteria group bacterium]
MYKSTIVIRKEGKWFVARSLELGVTSQGKTIEQAKQNLKEAVELYLEDMPKQKSFLSKEAPLVTSIEIGSG